MAQQRIFGLDLLRAIAILSVVWVHGGELLPLSVQRYYFLLRPDGVSVFFVLSGFLIGGILIRTLEGAPAGFRNLWHFWVRRWLRTLPNYYLVLTVLTAIHLHLGHRLSETAAYFFFFQNIAWPHPAFFIEAWSLSVEEWFYLLTPALLFLLAGPGRLPARKAAGWLGLAIILIGMGLRAYQYLHHPPQRPADWEEFFRKVVMLRLDALMFGVLGAWIAAYYPRLWQQYRRPMFITGLALLLLQALLPVSSTGWYHSVLSFTVFAAGILLLLPLLSGIRCVRGWPALAITRISLISYSMYLVHYSLVLKVGVLGYAYKWMGNFRLPAAAKAAISYAAYWLGTLVLASLLYVCFEQPVLRFRERIGRQGRLPERW